MEIIKRSDKLLEMEKKQLYISNVKPILNQRALFSDGTVAYRNPPQPLKGDTVTIRFRTAKYNVDQVTLVVCDNRTVMRRAYSDDWFDYYEAEIKVGDEPVVYYFEIILGAIVYYYNQIGASGSLNQYYNFKIIPGFIVPEWMQGSVIYQIYVDRFCNGDEKNDVVDREYAYIGQQVRKEQDWNAYPWQMDVGHFYGGDLKGVQDKLDYLKELGVDVIYFNPLFVSPSNHKYDIQDYDYIDPHIGVIVDDGGRELDEGDCDNTHASKYIKRVANLKNLIASNAFFANFVNEVHKRGMKVILDGVFNHCGSFNKWMDRERIYENQSEFEKGAFITKDSPYVGYFNFFADEWPYNHKYDGWWGHDTLPKLNYENSKELHDYIINVGKKWVSPPYNVDGWRLDVAADLGHSQEYNHQFWRDFRDAVKKANPNAVILAEHYGDAYDWLQGGEWDTVMNYDAFMEPVTWFLTGMEKHSDEYVGPLLGNNEHFFNTMAHHMSRMGFQSMSIAMNELSNHDHSRFLTRTNHTVGRVNTHGSEAASNGINKGIFKEAIVMQMTWPGAPTIYYGDEAGVCGWTDPDNRRTYPWGHEDMELLEFHRDIIKIHKANPALMRGSYKSLYGSQNVISYGRFADDNLVVVAINNSLYEVTITIPVWEIGIHDGDKIERILLTTQDGYNLGKTFYDAPNGRLTVTLEPIQAAIFRRVYC